MFKVNLTNNLIYNFTYSDINFKFSCKTNNLNKVIDINQDSCELDDLLRDIQEQDQQLNDNSNELHPNNEYSNVQIKKETINEDVNDNDVSC